MIVAGCDVGSTTGKVVIMRDDEIIASSIVPATAISRKTADIALEKALANNSILKEDIEYCVGTGYGRVNVLFAQKNITEISCHGLGAFWANTEIRTIIDIGGQDCKVIKIDENGLVKDFFMNEKCAAGTGRFLQDVCKALGITVEQLGPTSLEAKDKASVKISSQCSVFAQSEVTSLLKEKKSIADIAAGINNSVASRLVSMVHRVGLQEKVVLAGGVSKNIGVLKMLEEKLGVKMVGISYDPQLLGAIGAALFAKRNLMKKMIR